MQAVADGLKGKNSITVSGATLEIIAGGDGMQSYNIEDPARGYINILNGNIKITASQDGIQAQTMAQIIGGSISIKSGGGSSSQATSESTKGMKGINTVNKTTSDSSMGFAQASRPGAGGRFEQSDGSTFLMTGGTVYMHA